VITNNSPFTTVVIDTSVLMHNLHHKLSILDHTNPHWVGLVKAQLQYVASGCWLGDLKPDKFQIVFVLDSKPYWRVEYLTRPEVSSAIPRKKKADEKKRQRLMELLESINELGMDGDIQAAQGIEASEEFQGLSQALAIHYKAGRKLPEYSFRKIKKISYGVIREAGWNIIGVPRYEADDLAACFRVVNDRLDQPNRLLLVTIDSDWMGLINDHTAWYCMTGWFPRVRSDFPSANTWAEKRLGSALDDYTDLWSLKVQQGDKSDNLPPGTPREVIDLLNPPEEHKLWKQPIAEAVKDILEYPRRRPVNPKDALIYMGQLGVSPVIRPLDNYKDFVA